MNILAKDWRENLKKAGIKDYKQDILHIENQMKDEQIGSLGSVDTHQVKKDKRNDQETTRKEKAEAKSAAEKHFFDQNADIEVEESYSDKENNNDSDFDCPGIGMCQLSVNYILHIAAGSWDSKNICKKMRKPNFHSSIN